MILWESCCFMNQVKAALAGRLNTKLQSGSICAAEHHVAAEHQQQEHTTCWEGKEEEEIDGGQGLVNLAMATETGPTCSWLMSYYWLLL